MKFLIKTALLITMLVSMSLGQTHNVWKFKQNGMTDRPGYDKNTGYYHVTGSASDTSQAFNLSKEFNGLLTVEYIAAGDPTNLSFQVLLNGGTSYVPIDMTFTAITDIYGRTVYKWTSNPVSGSLSEVSPYSSFKVVMNKAAAVDLDIKMNWNEY